MEFKVGNEDPATIGQNMSALANSARLDDEPFGYIVWGVRDEDHVIVGTTADPVSQKIGNSELTNWLATQLTPPLHFEFTTIQLRDIRLVVLTIEAASFQPVQFKGVEYIRVGSYTKPLNKHPDYARRLWKSFEREPFELASARDRLTDDDVLGLLDYPSYFDLMNRPLPDNRAGILEALSAESLIHRMPGTGWRITNLGGLLLAKSLDSFPTLRRKALRVIQYEGKTKVKLVKEQLGVKGYANGFEGLIGYINGVLPANPVIGQALRTTTPVYPELAVRELVANALIHQDFTTGGAGPTIEIFGDRIEIANPGEPMVPVERLVDAPPRSRNEKLAYLLRRMGICEEQGSGWDKVAFQVEFYQLPAPIVEAGAGSTRITMLSPRDLPKMTREDRVRAVYLHACLRYTSREHTNNASIRTRFGIATKNKATASRLLGEAVKAGAIVPYDPDAPPKLMRYVPFWAQKESGQTDFVDE
ncbi:ATP-binding protein [Microbacterium sp.]|uniref:ATP-binding protein n=1 Tax=Microbacterium sp. TaxID=51671 RepID=UPI003F6FCE21